MSVVTLHHFSPQGWLQHCLYTRARLFPHIPWGIPPLALSCGMPPPTSLPSVSFLLGDIKIPERNIEWPAILLFRAVLFSTQPSYRQSYHQFITSGGLEALVVRQKIIVKQRITLAGGVGILMLCSQ